MINQPEPGELGIFDNWFFDDIIEREYTNIVPKPMVKHYFEHGKLEDDKGRRIIFLNKNHTIDEQVRETLLQAGRFYLTLTGRPDDYKSAAQLSKKSIAKESKLIERLKDYLIFMKYIDS